VSAWPKVGQQALAILHEISLGKVILARLAGFVLVLVVPALVFKAFISRP